MLFFTPHLRAMMQDTDAPEQEKPKLQMLATQKQKLLQESSNKNSDTDCCCAFLTCFFNNLGYLQPQTAYHMPHSPYRVRELD